MPLRLDLDDDGQGLVRCSIDPSHNVRVVWWETGWLAFCNDNDVCRHQAPTDLEQLRPAEPDEDHAN